MKTLTKLTKTILTSIACIGVGTLVACACEIAGHREFAMPVIVMMAGQVGWLLAE